jgi:hypothetical protein
MTLADYTFYVDDYQGNEIPSDYFDKYAEHANYVLQRMTQNRTVESYFERQYNLAICAIAEYYYADSDGINVKSESLGDYSVTYSDGNSVIDVYGLALQYLGNTGLLNGGINCY